MLWNQIDHLMAYTLHFEIFGSVWSRAVCDKSETY